MPHDLVQLGGFGTRYLAEGQDTGSAYALVEHTLRPGVMGAAPHRHAREDERSYVLEGTLTVWQEGAIVTLGPGGTIAKPRGRWHTVWNAAREPVRFLELISPPGFAGYFRELGAILSVPGPPDFPALGALAERYGLEFDFPTMEKLLADHGLELG